MRELIGTAIQLAEGERVSPSQTTAWASGVLAACCSKPSWMDPIGSPKTILGRLPVDLDLSLLRRRQNGDGMSLIVRGRPPQTAIAVPEGA